MKLFKKIRKGFTLIELVVVIAVIAILAAVSVVSYVAITNKAKESNDHMMIDQINTSVEASSIPSRKDTLHEVLEDLKEDAGFGVEKLKPELKDTEFVYSYSMNKFAYWKGNKVVYPKDVAESSSAKNGDLWFLVDVKSTTNLKDGHSHYVKSVASDITSLDVSAGLDVGNAFVSSINYAGEAPAKDVVIRTNSVNTDLVINAEHDTINHFGSVGKVDAQKVDMNCYNEYGKAAYVKITEGKVVAKSGGSISVVFAANNDGLKVAVIKENNGTISKGLTAIEPVSVTNESRANGIALEYSIDGTTAASMSESEKAAAITARETTANEEAAAAVEVNLIEEIEASGLYEARIGTVGYATLDEAYGNAHNGDTIVMLKSINRSENTEVVTRGMAVSLDLNGNTYRTESVVSISLSNMGYKASAICYSFGDTSAPAFEIKNGNILTKYGAGIYVDDPGVDVTLSNLNIRQDHENYVQTTNCYSSAVRLTYNAKATINSGTYEACVAIDIESSSLGNNGHVVVNGGSFNGLLHIYKDSTPLDFVVNGGTFKNTGLTYDQFSSFVSSGKTITTNSDGSWTVSNQ